MDAKMHFYTLKTKSNFLLEFPTKKVKNIELSANYSLGVNNALHHFDFQGYIFKNKEIKINIANLKVYATKNDRLYNIKIKKYSAVTEVNLNNKYLGKIQWNTIAQLNKGLSKLSKLSINNNLKLASAK